MRPVLCWFASASCKGGFPLHAATAISFSTGSIICQRRAPSIVTAGRSRTALAIGRLASSATAEPHGQGSPSASAASSSEPVVSAGPGEMDGPILADFLAMGAGRSTAPATLAESRATPGTLLSMQQTTDSEVAEARDDPTDLEELPELLVRERPLVVAALQRSEALAQVQLEKPSRKPLEPPRRSPGQVPEIFMEAHAGYAARCQEELGQETSGTISASLVSEAANAEKSEERSRSGLRKFQIRVRPWHRTHMQKALCRAVMFHFLQEIREVLGLRSEQHPLCFWEARYAWEQLHKGQVVELVKYLAETELHIEKGPERRKMAPGTQIGAEETQRVRAERRLLAREWSVRRRYLEEDAVLRVFLDGQLCWPSIRNLLAGSSAPLASEASGSRASYTM